MPNLSPKFGKLKTKIEAWIEPPEPIYLRPPLSLTNFSTSENLACSREVQMSLELMVMALWSFTPVPSPHPSLFCFCFIFSSFFFFFAAIPIIRTWRELPTSLFINTHGCEWLATKHAPHSTPLSSMELGDTCGCGNGSGSIPWCYCRLMHLLEKPRKREKW